MENMIIKFTNWQLQVPSSGQKEAVDDDDDEFMDVATNGIK